MLGHLSKKCCCEPVEFNVAENVTELSFNAKPEALQSKKMVQAHGDDEVCLSGVSSARSRKAREAKVYKRPEYRVGELDRRAFEDLKMELNQTQEALNRELEEAQLHLLNYRRTLEATTPPRPDRSFQAHRAQTPEVPLHRRADLSSQAPQAPNLPTTNLMTQPSQSQSDSREELDSDNSQVILLPHDVGAMMLRCEPVDDPLVFLTIDIKSHARMEALVSRLAGLPPGGCVEFGMTLKARQENQQIMFVRRHPLRNTTFGEVAVLFSRKMTLIGMRTCAGIIGWAPPDATRVNESDELLVVACTPFAFAAGLTKESFLSGVPNSMRHRMDQRMDDDEKGLNPLQRFPLVPDLKNRRCCS